MTLIETFLEILERPTTWAVVIGMIQFLGPVWIAFLCGVMVGWAWKPKWSGSLGNCKFDISAPSSPSIVGRLRLLVRALLCWIMMLRPRDKWPLGLVMMMMMFAGDCSLIHSLYQIRISRSSLSPKHDFSHEHIFENSSSQLRKEDEEDDQPLVNGDDLEYLCHLVKRKDGGVPWKHMMDHSTQSMSYQAWQRDPKDGPPQYCSRTVYEDASPELMRDFFWDDEFRLKWDNMLTRAEVLEECPSTGTMMFPFFCSDREYIIGRRMWESGRSYYCVTKGVPCASVPRKEKPRRVDIYYSSWFIQAVESRKGNGQLSACEVMLFHHEDMGISWEIARFGVRRGMWGAVKNIERGFRAYQRHRASGAALSHHALMAGIYTRLDQDYLKSLEGSDDGSSETQLVASVDEKRNGVAIPKVLIIGGAILVACSLDRGLLTKTLVYGVARKFGNIGRRTFSGVN